MISEESRFERVYLVTDFVDQIRAGVADYHDRPHYFETEWVENVDDYGHNIDLFLLTDEQFIAMQKEWLVWIELEQARLASQDSRSIGFKLESERRLKSLAGACAPPAIRARGVFRAVPGQIDSGIPFSGIEVQWLAPQPQDSSGKR